MIDERHSSLDAYRARRDPERTPEPFGGRRPGPGRLFVVQEHAARRLHYDLRLEMDGVLRSWAVPRGPSTRAEDRRLAVLVEDHPLEYADFEGTIPPGNYGAGAVIVWDRGWYRPVQPGDPAEHLARGRLDVELYGHKLRGRWTLARMSGKDREWLLIKKADAAVTAQEAVERYPRSVLSGLTVEEMRDVPAWRAALRARLDALGAPARRVSAAGQPVMLATLGERPFRDPAWLFEVKWDGVRVLAERDAAGATLRARSGQLVTARYPEVAAALAALPVEHALLDGEIVALDEEGRPSFQRLQARMHLGRRDDVVRAAAEVPVVAVLFDCLALERRDLRALPLTARKECLARVVPPLGVLRFGDHVAEDGPGLHEAVAAAGLEGIVAKRADSRYAGGRTRDWVKIKCQRRQEFVIGGYTEPRGSRAHLGALHVGVYDRPPAEGGRLVHVSKVGSGVDGADLERLRSLLAPLERDSSPFAAGSPSGRGHHWVQPRLVCEVRFTEWTADGGLRHPTFLGLRADKRPEECVREVAPAPPAGESPVPARPLPRQRPDPRTAPRRRPDAPAPASPGAGSAPAAAPPQPPSSGPEGRAGHGTRRVAPTNVGKVFWPEEGYTKGDLLAYYAAVAPWLLPYLRERPLVLTRYPDGIAGKSFFQKDAPGFVPAWVRTERIWSRDTGREIDYFVVDDADTLAYVVNLGTIPLHLWSARLGSLDRPDWLVLDLDPKGAPFGDVVRVARALNRLLEDLSVPAHPKTSGATGLHIMVPLGARYTHEEAKTFAHLLARLGVEAAPGLATIARPLRARGGKVYIDWGQNGHGRTIVAPLSVRPLPGAPVSCPLAWSEVTARLVPGHHTIKTMPRRLARRGDPLAPVLGPGIDMAAAVARIEARLGR